MTIATNAKIYPWAKIIHAGGNFSVGEHSQIDDFAFVNAGKLCTIGRFVHIASFVSIIGGGEFTIEDFAGLSAGCRVITGTDDYLGPFLTNPTVPREFTNYQISHVIIEGHAIIGTNAVIFPGVTIGQGAAVGACAVVRKDLPAWGIYAGEPLRKIGERDRVAILEKRRLFLEKLEVAADSIQRHA
jgi:galactoside O-acetyltransferase